LFRKQVYKTFKNDVFLQNKKMPSKILEGIFNIS